MEDQAKLYGQGRSSYIYKGKQYGNSKLPVVTQAPPGTPIHNYGLALDFYLTNSQGTTASWTVNDDWKEVVKIAKSLGADWGGDWTSFRDYPHFEWTGNLTYNQIFAGKKPTFKPLKTATTKSTTKKVSPQVGKEQYYTNNPKKVKLFKSCNLYTSVEFNDHTKSGIAYPEGTVFTIVKIGKSKAGTTRLKVASGYWISANKDIVKKV